MVLDEQFCQARALAFEEIRSGSAAAAGESAPTDSPAAPTSATSTAVHTTVPTAVGTATAMAVGATSTALQNTVPKISETAATYNSTTDVAQLTESTDLPLAQSATASPSTAGASATPSAQESELIASAGAIDKLYFSAAPTRTLSIQDTGLTPSYSPGVDIPLTSSSSHPTSSSTYSDPLADCPMPETISSWCSGLSAPSVVPDGDGTGSIDLNMFTAKDFMMFEPLFQGNSGQQWQDANTWNPNILYQGNNAYGNVQHFNSEGYSGNQYNYSSDGMVDSTPLLPTGSPC